MKILCTLISIILICTFIILTYLMQNNTLITNTGSLPPLNAVIYSVLIGIVSFLAGFILNQGKIEELKNSSTKQLRKAEKANIDTKESLDKIDRLNAKIETLETALQEAIKNRKS